MIRNSILIGDCLTNLRTLPDCSVHCVVTSPPYWGLRDYGVDGQLGLEKTPEEYVANMVEVFREVRRVLRNDGTLWLNLGDSYAQSGMGGNPAESEHRKQATNVGSLISGRKPSDGLKPKDLVGIPWSVAKALQQPYYTGRIKNERDRVWLAATIDAEGSICGFRHERQDDGRTRTGLHITITNSSTLMLDEAHRIWPASHYDHQKAGAGHLGTLDTFRWTVQGAGTKAELLRELYPYFIAKKKQALVAFNLLLMVQQGKRTGQLPIKDEVNAKRIHLTEILSDLNHQRPVDLPTWLVEPPSLYEPGFYLRQDIIWSKPNSMPESVRDRCTKSHEYLFLLSKSERYYFDGEAIAEPLKRPEESSRKTPAVFGGRDKFTEAQKQPRLHSGNAYVGTPTGTRNRRSVWSISTSPYKGAHFATFPPRLIEPCILAGTSAKGCCPSCGKPWERITERTKLRRQRPNDYTKRTGEDGTGNSCANSVAGVEVKTTGWQQSCRCEPAEPVPCIVADIFGGSGTTGMVAAYHGRDWLLCELNPDYAALAEQRITDGYTPPKVKKPKRRKHPQQQTLFMECEQCQ